MAQLPVPDLSTRIAGRVVAARWWLFAAGIIAAVLLWQPSSRLVFNRSIEDMFSPGDPTRAAFLKLKRIFGSNEIVMAVYEDKALFAEPGQKQLARLSANLSQLEGVAAVLSLTTIPGVSLAGEGGGVLARLRDMFEGYTHGRDRETAAVVCMLKQDLVGSERSNTLQAMRRLTAGRQRGTIIGEPVMVDEGFGLLEQDGWRLTQWSTVLVSATMLILFRSIRWMLIPLAVVQLAVISTRALLYLSGFEMTMVSSMLTAVVTVVGVATVVHLIVRFRDARAQHIPALVALRQTFAILIAPICVACLTDAVGFAALMTSRVGPVQDFGLMTAVGSLLIIPAVLCIVPGGAVIGPTGRDPQSAWGESHLDRTLRATLAFCRRGPLRIAAVLAVGGGFAAWGSSHLTVETDFTKNFRRSSRIVTAYEFVEERLGGAGVWDIIVPAPGRLDAEFLGRIRDLERQLRSDVPELVKVLSLADAIETIGLGVIASDRLMATAMPLFYGSLFNQDPLDPNQAYFRIMLRSPERLDAAAKERIIARVANIAQQAFPTAEVTGYHVLLARLIDSVLRDQWVAFAAATVGILLVMSLALRSWTLAIAGLIPSSLAILTVFGGLGWLGIRINLGGAMIAAVSLGLAVDASIHYLTVYRRACDAGRSMDQALDEAHATVGRAMVFSTLALIVGFSALCLSEFVPTVTFGAWSRSPCWAASSGT